MPDRESKEKQVERYLRQADKFVDNEERKRRQSASRTRRGTEGPRGPRRREWAAGEDEWDDEVTFEKIASRATGGAAAAARPLDESLPRATVVAVHRGQVELEGGRPARLAGRLAADATLSIVVGDEVAFTEHDGVWRVEGVAPRRSSLSRSDPGHPERELVLAANVDVAVIVAAAVDPPLRPGLIDRFLLGLERGGVDAVVCVNKADLLDGAERARVEELLAPYVELDLSIVRCSAATGAGLDALRELLSGKTCVFVGHSGVGKSTLLNAIDPDGARATGDVRAHDGRGRHTTTAASLRDLDDGTRVIDTPGVRAFGLERLTPDEVRAGYPELAAFAGACRFEDCTHAHEPACAVREAVEGGRLSRARYDSYLRVLAEG